MFHVYIAKCSNQAKIPPKLFTKHFSYILAFLQNTHTLPISLAVRMQHKDCPQSQSQIQEQKLPSLFNVPHTTHPSATSPITHEKMKAGVGTGELVVNVPLHQVTLLSLFALLLSNFASCAAWVTLMKAETLMKALFHRVGLPW